MPCHDFGLMLTYACLKYFAVAGVNHVEGLTKAYVEMKTDGRGRTVDRDHPHADVGHVGAQIEVAQRVEAGRGIVERLVYVSVEQETELGTQLPER